MLEHEAQMKELKTRPITVPSDSQKTEQRSEVERYQPKGARERSSKGSDHQGGTANKSSKQRSSERSNTNNSSAAPAPSSEQPTVTNVNDGHSVSTAHAKGGVLPFNTSGDLPPPLNDGHRELVHREVRLTLAVALTLTLTLTLTNADFDFDRSVECLLSSV